MTVKPIYSSLRSEFKMIPLTSVPCGKNRKRDAEILKKKKRYFPLWSFQSQHCTNVYPHIYESLRVICACASIFTHLRIFLVKS